MMRRIVVFFLVNSFLGLLVEGCFWSRDYGGGYGGYHHGHYGHHDRLDNNQQLDEPYSAGFRPLYYQNSAPQALPPPQYQPHQQLPQLSSGYPLWYKPEVPVLLRLPNSQTVVIPVKAVYSFPSFIERLVQRIQTYYSVYNPPESLTLDRPIPQRPIQGSEETEVSVQEEEGIVGVTEQPSVSVAEEAPVPEAVEGEGGPGAGASPAEKPSSAGQEPSAAGQTTRSPAKEPEAANELEPEKGKVSTLAVFEVSPTTLKPQPEITTEMDAPPETTTDADNYISPEGLPGSRFNSKFEIHSEPHQVDTSK